MTKLAKERPSLGVTRLKACYIAGSASNGQEWDFNKKDHREEAVRICEDEYPDWVIGSPPFTVVSVLNT